MTELVPTNISDMIGKIETLFKQDSAFEHVVVHRGEPINENPAFCPWLGIYGVDIRYPPRAVGYGTGYRYQYANLLVIAQVIGVDGVSAELSREELVQNVLRVLFSNATLEGLAQGLGEDVDVVYPDYRRTDRGYMQTAAIYFSLIGAIRPR